MSRRSSELSPGAPPEATGAPGVMVQFYVVSDTVCPWGLIGKRRRDKARAERPDLKPAVRWRVFQLNPMMPKGGMERQSYLAMKFGGADNAEVIYDRIRRVGAEDGIDFAFEDIARTPSTNDSHRLIRWAAGQDRPPETVEALFPASFLRGEKHGAPEVLAAAAESAGMDPAEAPALPAREDLDTAKHRRAPCAEGVGHFP